MQPDGGVSPVPSPTAWGFGAVQDTSGNTFVLVQVSHITGHTAVFVSPDEAIDVGNKIIEAGQQAKQLHSGLITPPTGLIAPNGQPLRLAPDSPAT